MISTSDRLNLVRILQASEEDLSIRYRMCQAMDMTPEEEKSLLEETRRSLDPSISAALAMDPIKYAYLKIIVMMPCSDGMLGYLTALDLSPGAFLLWQNRVWKELHTCHG